MGHPQTLRAAPDSVSRPSAISLHRDRDHVVPVGERLQVFPAPEGRGDLEHLVGVENMLRMPD